MNVREEMAEIMRSHVDTNITFDEVADAIIRRIIEVGPTEAMSTAGWNALKWNLETPAHVPTMRDVWRAMWEAEVGK